MRLPDPDKLAHFAAGSIASLFGLLFGPWGAFGAALGVAFAREAYNWHQGGYFDPKDIAYTLAGGAVPIVAALVGVSAPALG